MKTWLVCTIFAALCLAPVSAIAQNAENVIIPESLGMGYSITAGAMFAVSSNIVNDAQPTVGVAWYGPVSDNLGNAACIGLSGDWIPMKRNNGQTVNMMALLFNYKAYGYASGYRLFTSLGVGVLGTSDPIPEMQLKGGANFGWSASFGIDLTNDLFGQVRFIGSQNPGDDGMAGVELGYRF